MLSFGKFLLFVSALGALGGAVFACAGSDDEGAPGPKLPAVETARSSLARELNPTLTDEELETLARGQASFAVDMLRTLGTGSANNLFLSPHSISVALGMAYAGARGETAAEMKKTLHLELPDARVHVAFDYLDLALASRGAGQSVNGAKPFRLRVENSLWGQRGLAFEAPFLDTLAVSYGAGVNLVDFAAAPDGSRSTINAWVAAKTENRIPELLGPGSINPNTKATLVNAVYFNAAWQTRFLESGTQPGDFTKLDTTTTTAKMMRAYATLPYASADGYEAVSLPYEGSELSFLVIAPTTGNYATFESALTGQKVLDIMAGLSPQSLNLTFPKLKLDAAFDLKGPLQSLGMQRAFGDADFTGMTKQPVAISSVVHKTLLALDENGTEAAAATAVVFADAGVSRPPQVITMNVNRPFLMAIVDRATRTLVFFGRILDPNAN